MDAEEGKEQKVGVGSFTKAFTQYTTGQDLTIDWSGKLRPLRAVYNTSKSWTDFSFHLPTPEDYASYWDSNFPKFTRPLLKVLNMSGVGGLFCCCACVARWLRRLQMVCLPPREIDTGHGFKLVKS